MSMEPCAHTHTLVSRPSIHVCPQMTTELRAIDQASQEAAKAFKPAPEPEKPEKSAENKEDKGKGKKDPKEKVCVLM